MKLRFEEFSFDIDENGHLESVKYVSNGVEYPYKMESYGFIMHSFCEKYNIRHFMNNDDIVFRFTDNTLNDMLRDGTPFSTIFMLRGLGS
jgi:hypothetical protein